MSTDKPVVTVGMNIRRGGARLRAMSKAHSTLHVLLWQAKETERTLLASAATQKTLLADMATWASAENRALSDVCSNFSELNTLAAAAQAQLAQAYKSFRKNMVMILEGEKRADAARRKLQEAEGKRHKIRRLVLQAQNRTQITAENLRNSGDYLCLQTQLAEAERAADRAHLAACEARSESEAVKLVVVRCTLSKLSNSQVAYSHQVRTIFQGGMQLVVQIPDPPPPGDLLSCIRYDGFESTRIIVNDLRAQIQILSTSPTNQSRGMALESPPINTSHISATTSSSPLSIGNWSSISPTAPENPFLVPTETDPPPPYNTNYYSPPRNQQEGIWSQSQRNRTGRISYTNSVSPTNNSSSTLPPIQTGNNGAGSILSPGSLSYTQPDQVQGNQGHNPIGGRY